MTRSEKLFWFEVQERKHELGRIRRQVGIGRYIVDFLQSKVKLVIEIDGSVHQSVEAKQRDAERTSWLEKHGYRVIRFTNNEIHHCLSDVIQKITVEIHNPVSKLP